MMRRPSTGFTLIELLFVVTLIGIMIAIAVPSFASFISNYRATSAVNDLLESITLARTEALKRGRRVTLSPISGNWTSGWTVYVDHNAATTAPPTFDPTTGPVVDELIFRHDALPTSLAIAAPPSSTGIFGNTNYVAFDGTGYVRDINGATIVGGIVLTDHTGGTFSYRTLCLAQFGRPRIIKTATAPSPCS